MRNSLKKKVLSPVQLETLAVPVTTFDRKRMVRYIGSVTRALNERLLAEIEKLVNKDSEREIILFVTSTGGPTGSAMSFYDTLRHIIKPNLITIGSGDVDSSGIIIFLTGDIRYVTPNTTLLLHPAGRTFDGSQRYTTLEIEVMLAEDRLKDQQYAAVVAERSNGRLGIGEVLEMMRRHTILSPAELVAYGLAHAVLP